MRDRVMSTLGKVWRKLARPCDHAGPHEWVSLSPGMRYCATQTREEVSR